MILIFSVATVTANSSVVQLGLGGGVGLSPVGRGSGLDQRGSRPGRFGEMLGIGIRHRGEKRMEPPLGREYLAAGADVAKMDALARPCQDPSPAPPPRRAWMRVAGAELCGTAEGDVFVGMHRGTSQSSGLFTRFLPRCI